MPQRVHHGWESREGYFPRIPTLRTQDAVGMFARVSQFREAGEAGIV
jgi:hypothetical protein